MPNIIKVQNTLESRLCIHHRADRQTPENCTRYSLLKYPTKLRLYFTQFILKRESSFNHFETV